MASSDAAITIEISSEKLSLAPQGIEKSQVLAKTKSATLPVQDKRVATGQVAVQLEVPLASSLPHDIMLGVQTESPQYGILGEVSGHKVVLDLNQTHTISLVAVQGAGKSYTLGSIWFRLHSVVPFAKKSSHSMKIAAFSLIHSVCNQEV